MKYGLIFMAALLECSASPNIDEKSVEQKFATILEAPPYAPIERLGPEPYMPTLQDRRAIFADKLEHNNLPMLRRLKKGEIGNFGGIEWQWQDGAGHGGLGSVTGVTYFVKSPEASLRRYTSSPLFKAAKGDFARTEQDAVARGWADRIGPDVASPGFGNMDTPWLSISISRAEFLALSEAQGWDIPVNLTLAFSDYAEPDMPAVAQDVAADIRAFPSAGRLAGPTPDIATYDAIVLRDGCFFIDEEGDNDPLAMFPLGVGVYRDGEGHMAFRSRYSGFPKRLARVGTRMQLGARQGVVSPPEGLLEACGQHPVVLVKSLDQAAGYGGAWFYVKQNAKRLGLSNAEAMQRANDCLIENEQVWADRRLRGSSRQLDECSVAVRINPPPPGSG
ncbi:hypothetical protein [Pontixanthobacter sp.]|uniref:hypothetical protein n=1 Tax=Pontixanthobacter sp. TaxID=2792078 RepID=UPI003C7C5FF1